MMKVAFYMTTILEHGGGLEKYLIETSSELAKRPGISADVITRDNRFTNKIIKALSIFYMRKIDIKLSYKEKTKDIKTRLGEARYLKIKSFKTLRAELNKYDVIYSKNEILEAFIFKYVIGYKRIPPIVFGGHTALIYTDPNNFHEKLHNFLYGGIIYKFLASGVSGFHALNESDERKYKQLFPNKQTMRIYNPFAVERFKKASVDHHYPVAKGNQIVKILWVGRLTEQKGISSLVRVVHKVNELLGKDNSSVVWNIVGDGELKHQIQDLKKNEHNVNYYGHIEQNQIASVYEQNNVFLCTSRWEGYPYTLIESQVFGLCVYAYNIPGVSDILKSYTGGVLVEGETDMIETLIKDIKHYLVVKDVPINNYSNQFEPKKIYNQIIALLESYA